MKTKEMSRHHMREAAFQALCAIDMGQQDLLEAVHFAVNGDREVGDERELPVFLLDLVTGVSRHQEDLDRALSEKLKKGWSLNRLTLVDKNLMRLGLYEIREEETPDKVAINEVIELAKAYTDSEGRQLINGVLSQFITS